MDLVDAAVVDDIIRQFPSLQEQGRERHYQDCAQQDQQHHGETGDQHLFHRADAAGDSFRQQNQQQDQDPQQQPEDEKGDDKDSKPEEQKEDQEVEATLKKAQERNDEHEADKKARMRKAPLPPNERDW